MRDASVEQVDRILKRFREVLAEELKVEIPVAAVAVSFMQGDGQMFRCGGVGGGGTLDYPQTGLLMSLNLRMSHILLDDMDALLTRSGMPQGHLVTEVFNSLREGEEWNVGSDKSEIVQQEPPR